MKTLLQTRYSGFLLRTAAVVGAIIGLVLLIGLWGATPFLYRGLNAGIDFAAQTLDTAASILTSGSDVIAEAQEDVTFIADSAVHVADTLESTALLSRSISGLVGTDLRMMAEETQKALDTTRTSARVVDDTLRLIGSIPIVGKRYQPDVPLEQSIAQVSRSMAEVPASLEKIQGEMFETSRSLHSVQGDIRVLYRKMNDINEELTRTRAVLDRYNENIAEFQTLLPVVRGAAPWVFGGFVLLNSLLLVWFIIAQMALYAQGEMMQAAAIKTTPIES